MHLVLDLDREQIYQLKLAALNHHMTVKDFVKKVIVDALAAESASRKKRKEKVEGGAN